MHQPPDDHSLHETAAKGGAISLGSGFLFNGMRLAAAMILTRLLGKEDYGRYVIGLSVLMVLSGVAGLGLPQAILRWGAIFHRSRQTRHTAYLLRLAGLVAALAVLLFGAGLYVSSPALSRLMGDPALARVFRWFLLALPVIVASELLAAFARAFEDVLGYSLAKEILPASLQLIGIIIVAALTRSMASMIAVLAGAYFLACLFGLAYLSVRHADAIHDAPERPKGAFQTEFLWFSLAVTGTGFFWVLRDRIAVLLIGRYISSADAGVFFNASRLAVLLTVILAALNTILASQAASLLHQGATESLQRLYRSVVRWALIASFPAFSLLLFQPALVMAALFHMKDAPAGQVLSVLVALRFALLFAGSPGVLLHMAGHARTQFFMTVLTVLALAGSLFYALPRWGLLGAAAASGSVWLVMDILRAVIVFLKTGIAPLKRQDLGITLALATALQGGYYLLRPANAAWGWLWAIALTGGATALLARRLLSREDRALLRRALLGTGQGSAPATPLSSAWDPETMEDAPPDIPPSRAEEERIRAVYAKRDEGLRIGFQSLCDLIEGGKRAVAVFRILREQGQWPISDKRIADFGCGTGGRLREFMRLGALPDNLYGMDLSEERIRICRSLFPNFHVHAGSAAETPYADGFFDLVSNSTMMSSVLDDALAERIAREMLRVLNPGGLILWYDLRYRNPWNREVRGYDRRAIRRLFPKCRIRFQSMGLPPQVTERLECAPFLYHLLHLLPPLRIHLLAAIAKGPEGTLAVSP
ncbi:MAG: oligosaccharide flippase family protein [Planctomycetota bacterium]